MKKRSDLMTKGPERAPHRSLLRADGFSEWEMVGPIIGIANSFTEIIPGHMHLDKLVESVKAGVYAAGGTPVVFNTIGVCDGIAMNHVGMKYSLPSRELIADSIEIMATAHPFDGLVLMASCDKIVPGMLNAAAALNIPSIFLAGGPMLPGRVFGRGHRCRQDLRGGGEFPKREDIGKGTHRNRMRRLPRTGVLLRHVHRQHHVSSVGGARHVPSL